MHLPTFHNPIIFFLTDLRSISRFLQRTSDAFLDFFVIAMSQAVRFVAGVKKAPHGILYLRCHVKPSAAKAREGVVAVTDEVIELCVSAQAREGEANKAVVKLLSEVTPPCLQGLGQCH